MPAYQYPLRQRLQFHCPSSDRVQGEICVREEGIDDEERGVSENLQARSETSPSDAPPLHSPTTSKPSSGDSGAVLGSKPPDLLSVTLWFGCAAAREQ